MKIFFIVKDIHSPGGIERATIVVANGLAEKGHNIGLIAIVKAGEPYFNISKKVSLKYLTPHKEKYPFPIKDFVRYKKLRNLYKSEQPDFIIIVDSARAFLNIPAARGFKKITWEHFNANVKWNLMHGVSRRKSALESDWIVTLTNRDTEVYKQKYGIINVSSIANPITLETIHKTPLTEKVVLAVGRLHEQKGFDMLVDAWEKVENRNNGWKLRIIGTGKMENLIRQKIKDNNIENSVEIFPPTRDIHLQYPQASIYVMSSRYEGLPLVLIEAMASGLPIVSFDCETGPRDIVVDRETGVLVPTFNLDILAKELDILIEDAELRKKYSENAVQRSKLFSLNSIVAKWENLFEKLNK